MPLTAYVSNAMGNGIRADGLLQRFQLTVWPDTPRKWEYVDELLSFLFVIIVPLLSYDEPNVSLIQNPRFVRLSLTGHWRGPG